MKKTNLDYCLREITYTPENITLKDWEVYMKDHIDSPIFRAAVLKCQSVPESIISNLCKNYILLGDTSILALQNTVLPTEIKTKFIVPNMNSYDIVKYVNNTIKEGIPIDIGLTDFLIDSESYNDNIRNECYRLINEKSKYYPAIHNCEYDKLTPQFNEAQILSRIVDNSNLPIIDRVNAYKDGCNINSLINPPDEIIPEILELCFCTLTSPDRNNDGFDIATNILTNLFDTGKVKDQTFIHKIVDTYLEIKDYIPECVFIRSINSLKDQNKLSEIIDCLFAHKPFLFTAVKNPNYNRTAHAEQIMKHIDTLDYIGNTDALKRTLDEIRYLLRNSTLTDKQYHTIINSNKNRLVDFIAESRYTPAHIMKQIVDKFPNNSKYDLLYNLNQNKSDIPPSIYSTIVNFFSKQTHDYPYIMVDKLFIHGKIDLENFKDENFYHNSYISDLTFDKEIDLIVNDVHCHSHFLKALDSVMQKSYGLEFDRKLSLLKHSDNQKKYHSCNHLSHSNYVSAVCPAESNHQK